MCVSINKVSHIYPVLLSSWWNGPSCKDTSCKRQPHWPERSLQAWERCPEVKSHRGQADGRSPSIVPTSLWPDFLLLLLQPHRFAHLRPAPLPLAYSFNKHFSPVLVCLFYLLLIFSYIWLFAKSWTRWKSQVEGLGWRAIAASHWIYRERQSTLPEFVWWSHFSLQYPPPGKPVTIKEAYYTLPRTFWSFNFLFTTSLI